MTGHAKKRSTDADGDENSDNHKVPEKDNTPQSTKKDNFVVPKIPSPVMFLLLFTSAELTLYYLCMIISIIVATKVMSKRSV